MNELYIAWEIVEGMIDRDFQVRKPKRELIIGLTTQKTKGAVKA